MAGRGVKPHITYRTASPNKESRLHRIETPTPPALTRNARPDIVLQTLHTRGGCGDGS